MTEKLRYPNTEDIKRLAQSMDCGYEELLALSRKSDPFYIEPNHRLKAEWFLNVWTAEGKPKIHLRGLHYRLLGKGYTILLGRGGNREEPYENTDRCFEYLLTGAQYARYLNMVPYADIPDEKNPDPTRNSRYGHESPFQFRSVSIIDSYSVDVSVSYWVQYEDTDELIEDLTERILEKQMVGVNYVHHTYQPNHIEIWAEKSGVIPGDVARRFNATTRPAGGGEMSVRMCFDALNLAQQYDQDLHIFMLVDFDPKGSDMPRSVARKIEFMSQDYEAEAFVHEVALTLEQCKEYGLPTEPAKRPKSDSQGAKSYREHTRIWKAYAGQDPTEINAFESLHPQAYRDTIARAIDPFFDESLQKRIDSEMEAFKENLKKRIEKTLRKRWDQIDSARQTMRATIEEFQDGVDTLKESLHLEDSRHRLYTATRLKVKELPRDMTFEIPDAVVEEPVNPLLDTRRAYLKQIAKYREFDIRS